MEIFSRNDSVAEGLRKEIVRDAIFMEANSKDKLKCYCKNGGGLPFDLINEKPAYTFISYDYGGFQKRGKNGTLKKI